MPKKIFFSYADAETENNPNLIRDIKLHFSQLSGDAQLLFKEEQFVNASDKEQLKELLKSSDCKVHLLSRFYTNDAGCMEQLAISSVSREKVFPVLLSSFYIGDDSSPIGQLREQIMPDADHPVESHPNFNQTIAHIVQTIAEKGLGIRGKKNGRLFYYIIAALVFIIGIAASFFAHTNFGFIVALVTLIMFICIAGIVLINVWKPTSISLFKF